MHSRASLGGKLLKVYQALSLVVTVFLVIPVHLLVISPAPIANAATPVDLFSDSFGESFSAIVTDWADSDGAGEDARISTGTPFPTSPTDGHARLRKDESIAHVIETTGHEDITLYFDWKGDGDVEDDGEHLLVEWKPSADGSFIPLLDTSIECTTDCDDVHPESFPLPATANDTFIDIKFTGFTDALDEEARIDDVLVTGVPVPGALPELPGFEDDICEELDLDHVLECSAELAAAEGECAPYDLDEDGFISLADVSEILALCGEEGPHCGDGELYTEEEGDDEELYEECDDGNTEDGDGCSAECTLEPVHFCEEHGFDFTAAHWHWVGEEYLAIEPIDELLDIVGISVDAHWELIEEHPDYTTDVTGDDKEADWTSSPAVDGSIRVTTLVDTAEPGGTEGTHSTDGDEESLTDLYLCDNEEIKQTPDAYCGDWKIDEGEQCDDGNIFNGDGCNYLCQHEINQCEFPLLLDFDELSEGTVVTDQYAAFGITVSAENNNPAHPDKAVVFDSEDPTGGDTDLGTPNEAYAGPGIGDGGLSNLIALFKLLIIGENDTDEAPADDLVDDPDDEADGGKLIVEFDEPVAVTYLDVIDSEEEGGTVKGFDAGDSEVFSEPILDAGDNSYQNVLVNQDEFETRKLEVSLVASGAIDNLLVCLTHVCGDESIDGGEQCDDGNTEDGDGCSAQCQLEDGPQCEEVDDDDHGWYGRYYNYPGLHPDMNLHQSFWPDDNHGDPQSDVSPWDTDWYEDDPYFRFSRVDGSLEFGNDFFPFDIAPEEIDHGHEFHFGAHWRALVTAPAPGIYNGSVSSDDDAWIYLDGELITDNAGIQQVATELVQMNLTGSHVVDIYFAERHTTDSFFSFGFDDKLTITPLPPGCEPEGNQCEDYDLDVALACSAELAAAEGECAPYDFVDDGFIALDDVAHLLDLCPVGGQLTCEDYDLDLALACAKELAAAEGECAPYDFVDDGFIALDDVGHLLSICPHDGELTCEDYDLDVALACSAELAAAEGECAPYDFVDDGFIALDDVGHLLSICPHESEEHGALEVCKLVDHDGLGFTKDETFYTDGWGITIYDGATSTASGLTSDNGCILFPWLPVGTYGVDEGEKDGWSPTEVFVNGSSTAFVDSFFDVWVEVTLNNTSTVDFLNHPTPTNTVYECSDNIDNEDDGFTDSADPDCHTDGDPNNPDSYDPTRDEDNDDGDNGGGGTVITTSSGGGGGGGGSAGLNIHTEASDQDSTTQVTITWFTNVPATSRVVYDTASRDPLGGSAPNYGYANSTTEDTTKKTFHSVTITGLTPDIPYYFRPVSVDGSSVDQGIELTIALSETPIVLGEQTPEGGVGGPEPDEPQAGGGTGTGGGSGTGGSGNGDPSVLGLITEAEAQADDEEVMEKEPEEVTEETVAEETGAACSGLWIFPAAGFLPFPWCKYWPVVVALIIAAVYYYMTRGKNEE